MFIEAEEKGSISVKTLLQRARSGDDKAFVQIFQEHVPTLWRTAMGCLHDENDAADALQETTIKAWRTLPSFKGHADIGTWLTRILLNTCFDTLRARKKLIPFSDITEADTPASAEFQSGNNDCNRANDFASSVSDRLDVEAILVRLPDDDRAILTLFYANDFSIRQISEILGISEAAVRTRLTRARERFKRFYTDQPSSQTSNQPSDQASPSVSEHAISSSQRITGAAL